MCALLTEKNYNINKISGVVSWHWNIWQLLWHMLCHFPFCPVWILLASHVLWLWRKN